jgi:hypothetical protein
MAAGDEIPKYYATRKYKIWVKAKLLEKGWTYPQFAAQVTRRGSKCSGQALHKLLGNRDAEPVASNTTLMPAINKALGLPVPTHFDPTSPLSRLHASLDANWDHVPEETQKALKLLIAGRDAANE